MRQLFSWIQISDLHFGHGDETWGWDQLMVLECLRKDAERVDVPKPNFIFITGDVAFSGNSRTRPGESSSHEYADATSWIESLRNSVGLNREAVFVVPGNHDIDRSADKDRATSRLVRVLREGQESLDTALADPNDRNLLTRRLKNYGEFAAGFGPSGLKATAEAGLSWSHTLGPMAGLKLRLIGLNTALLAADEFDFGKLRIGRRTLAQTIYPPLDRNELTIVMSHHPLQGGWLADERDVSAWVSSHAHILLSGHVHEPDSVEIRAGSGGSIVRIAAGASHEERGPSRAAPSHGYNHAAIFLSPKGTLILRIWPRRWSEKNKEFRTDSDNVPPNSQYSEHEIRSVQIDDIEIHQRSSQSTTAPSKSKAPDTYQEIPGITETARRILVERPEGWEVRFFSQTLADELSKNDDLKRDWSYELADEQPEYYDPHKALKWISSQTNYLVTLAGGFTKLINEALPAAMGPPGKHGDARQLFYVASRLADGHRKAIRWAISFRRLAVDTELRPVLKEAQTLSETVVSGVEKFSIDIQNKLAELLEAGRYEGPAQTVHINLVLEAPNVKGLERELKRLSRRYGF